jgi:Sensors of blue-light using FAD
MSAISAQPKNLPSVDQLAYCSLASPSVLSLALVSQLLANPQDISGLLMWNERLMIHWLEASAEQIDQLWTHVQSDPQQHCVVRLLHRRDSKKRLFTDWQMRETSRQDMMVIVREAKEEISKPTELEFQDSQWQHATSTLGILLDPALTSCYAQTTGSAYSSARATA